METHKLTEIEKAKSIIKHIEKYFNVDLKRRTRSKIIVIPRQLAMYYIRRNLSLTFVEIGRLFPFREKGILKYIDHSTVIHAQRTIEGHLEYDFEVKHYHKELIKDIENISKYNRNDLEKYKSIDNILTKLNSYDCEKINNINKILTYKVA